MLRDAIDKDPEGAVWHVNTKHLMTFAQMVADKTRREMSSPTKIMGPNLEAVLNSAGFYKKDLIRTQEEWDEYIIQKKALELANQLLENRNSWPRLLLVRPGSIATQPGQQPPEYMDVNEYVQAVYPWILKNI